MGELSEIKIDLAQFARLALAEQTEDVRLFAARLVRKYRDTDPELSKQMDSLLRSKPTVQANRMMREAPTFSSTPHKVVASESALPVDVESRLSLLKAFRDPPDREAPLLSSGLKETLNQLIQERRQSDRLALRGLHPARSAIFVGQPGIGKTLTARWLAAQLGVPLYVLDLTAVMSSLLGRSGNNIRTALDFAKRSPSVLLLDEIDAVAKRRSDATDIGELKRLVTVIMQEVDEWPSSGLLLGATNHPELIDPALWRRFDLVVNFTMPEAPAIKEAIKQFLGSDYAAFSRWLDILVIAFNGQSFSDIERTIQRFRRAAAMGTSSVDDLVEALVRSRALTLDRAARIVMARELASHKKFSQHSISAITGVSRDTIRKKTTKGNSAI